MKLHDEDFVMPWKPWVEVINETSTYKNAANHHLIRAAKAKATMMVRWIPLDIGWLKHNTDGASNKECEIAGCGGLIGGAYGVWKIGFSKSLGILQCIYC